MLWNAHVGLLWRRFSIHLRREIAKRAGLSQRRFREHTRVSFAKVAEYQKRGAVHFHAVIHLDGPGDGDTPPPAWGTADLLTDAVGAAAAKARVDGPTIDGRAHTFTFGRRLDVRTIRSADFDDGQELTERAVAAYIAKYATKGAETETTCVLAHWVFAGTGLSDTEAWLTASPEPAPGTEGEPIHG